MAKKSSGDVPPARARRRCSFPADLLRFGVPFRLIGQFPAVGGYSVAGGLTGVGLPQGCRLPELILV